MIDFNADGLPDIIYSGRVGEESNAIIFLINNNGIYEEAFSGRGELVALEQISDWLPFRFRVLNYACCSDLRNFIEDYVPVVKNGKLSYLLSNRILIDVRTKPPVDFFSTPRFFKIENQNCSLRNGPVIDDKVYESEFGKAKGNVIASYSSGSIGKAIASKEDSTGKVWWFVIMDSSNNIKWELFSHHRGSNSIEKAKLSGWMSSRFLHILSK